MKRNSVLVMAAVLIVASMAIAQKSRGAADLFANAEHYQVFCQYSQSYAAFTAGPGALFRPFYDFKEGGFQPSVALYGAKGERPYAVAELGASYLFDTPYIRPFIGLALAYSFEYLDRSPFYYNLISGPVAGLDIPIANASSATISDTYFVVSVGRVNQLRAGVTYAL